MYIEIGDAERIIIYRLLSRLNPQQSPSRIWTVEDACITARQIRSRFGIPADATCWHYEINYPNEAWTVTLRAVWRGEALFRPMTTHVALT